MGFYFGIGSQIRAPACYVGRNDYLACCYRMLGKALLAGVGKDFAWVIMGLELLLEVF